jgi:hypothetical protein
LPAQRRFRLETAAVNKHDASGLGACLASAAVNRGGCAGQATAVLDCSCSSSQSRSQA